MKPDICVFDLDPADDDQRPSALGGACSCATVLDELGLTSWVKTSGSKGFHIVVPLDGTADYGDVAQLCAPRRRAAGSPRSGESHAGVSQGGSRRAHPRRHRAQRVQRDVRRRVRASAPSPARPSPRRARGRKSNSPRWSRGRSRFATWRRASRMSEIFGRIC